LSLAEPILPSEKEKALDLDISQIVLRRLIVSGKKDCCWCEQHLKCGFERRNYVVGFYCNIWSLSRSLEEMLRIKEASD